MAYLPIRAGAADLDFSGIRAEFGLPGEYPADALVEAQAANGDDSDRIDATDLPLVTLDPPGAKDLDQAALVRETRHGFEVNYAIADLGAVVTPGGVLDAEVRRRGQTMYLPDDNIPLHPTELSEGSASLLPGEARRAALWTIRCDADGTPIDVRLARAKVRSVEQLDYAGVQAAYDAGTLPEALAALPALGRLRREAAIDRGAIELQLPEQEVDHTDEGWRLFLRPRNDIEAWNAEISLLTGMCAANMMLAADVGILRTLPEPDEAALAQMRRSVHALGIDWPAGRTVARLLAGLDPQRPESLAAFTSATRLLRGAGYESFDGTAPKVSTHAGIGAAYAHVTAPLRRLVDRFGTEVCLALSAGVAVPDWVRAALPELPSTMGASDQLAAKVDRACTDQVEAWLLADHVGREFDAVVLRADDDGGEVFVMDPPVLGHCAGRGLVEGELTRIRLTEADPGTRTVGFERA
jgi:exoribonuclease R